MYFLRDFWILYTDELKQSFKSKKALVLLLVYALLLLLGIKLENLFLPLKPFLWEHVSNVPFLFPLTLALIWLPLIVLLLSYDSLSGEIATGSICYLSFRTGRLSVFLSKSFALVTLLGCSTFLLFVVADRGEGNIVGILALTLYLTLYASSLLSVVFLGSVIIKKPQKTLYLCFAVFLCMVFLLFSKIGSSISLFHYASWSWYPSILFLLGFTLLYGGTAFIIFRRIDL